MPNTSVLPIPAHAEMVIEGVLHPGDVEPEGPLGEFTGYYGRERSPQPVIEVKALHTRAVADPHRRADGEISVLRDRRLLRHHALGPHPRRPANASAFRRASRAYAHPAAASGWGMVVVALQQQYAGHAAQVLALTAQCPAAAYYTKWIIAVDEDVDPTDFNEVMWALSTRCHPSDDIDMLRKTWSTGLDPSQYIAGGAALRLEGR